MVNKILKLWNNEVEVLFHGKNSVQIDFNRINAFVTDVDMTVKHFVLMSKLELRIIC